MSQITRPKNRLDNLRIDPVDQTRRNDIRERLMGLLGEELIRDYEVSGFQSPKGENFIRLYFKGLGLGFGKHRDLPLAFDKAKQNLRESLRHQRDRLDEAINKLKD